MSELTPDARAVLNAGRSGDEPTDADQARLRRALLQAIAVGAVGTAGAAGAKAMAGAAAGEGAAAAAAVKGALVAKGAAGAVAAVSTSAAVTGKILAAIALVGAIGGGALVSRLVSERAPAEPPPAAVTAAGARGQGSKADSAKEAAAPSEGAEAEGAREPAIAAEPEKPLRAGDRGKVEGYAAAEEGSPGTLAEETRELAQVRAALQAGKADEALAMLDKGLPADKGELREERAAARILALCKVGRTKEAQAAAARFVLESPRSPLVDRVKSACSSAPRAGEPAGSSAPPAAPEQGKSEPARPADTSPPFENDTSPPFDGDIIE